MEEIKKKLVDIFKLEERVLYDAAGAADIVAAAEAEAQAQQEAADRAAEEARQAAEEAAKNAPPEDPSVKNDAEAGVAADIEAADNGIDVDSLADGEFADVDDMGEADDIAADTAVDDLRGDDNDDTLYAEAFTPEVEEVRELVVINSSVKDAQKIIDSLGENTDVLILENGKDGLDQINDYLDEHSDVKYSALHIVSHGNAGYFTLCGEVIDGEAVANDPASWANIGEHLTEDGDIMLYACNLAGNEQGQLLVSQIASLTNADVAASVDTTGVRGNWDLEYSIGAVKNEFISPADYNQSLANITFTITGDSDNAEENKYSSWKSAYEAMVGGNEYTFVLEKDVSVTTDMLDSDLSIRGNFTLTVNTTDTDNTVNARINVNGTNITFENALSNRSAGSITVSRGGTVSYAANSHVLEGTYNNISVTGGIGSEITVMGQLSGSGVISGAGTVTFTQGAAGFNGVTSVNGLSVYYTNQTVLGGAYNVLGVTNASVIDSNADGVEDWDGVTSINTLAGSRDITVDAALDSKVSSGFAMTGGTVTYVEEIAVKEGSYYNLAVEGSEIEINAAITLGGNWAIGESQHITIAEGATLTLNAGANLAVNGILTIDAATVVNGSDVITGFGSVDVNNSFTVSEGVSRVFNMSVDAGFNTGIEGDTAPTYSEALGGWTIDGNTVINALSDGDLVVTVSQNGTWVIGDVDTGVAVADKPYYSAEINEGNGGWTVDGTTVIADGQGENAALTWNGSCWVIGDSVTGEASNAPVYDAAYNGNNGGWSFDDGASLVTVGGSQSVAVQKNGFWYICNAVKFADGVDVVSGRYNNVVLGNAEINAAVSVLGEISLNTANVVSGIGSLVLEAGATTKNINGFSYSVDDGVDVTYNGQTVLTGHYGTLTLNQTSVDSITDWADIGADVLAGSFTIEFDSSTAAGISSFAMSGGTITYTNGNVIGGTYHTLVTHDGVIVDSEITINNAWTIEQGNDAALSENAVVNLAQNGTLNINGTLSVGGENQITGSGNVNIHYDGGSIVVGDGVTSVFNMAGGTVTYKYGLKERVEEAYGHNDYLEILSLIGSIATAENFTIYGGTYNDLAIGALSNIDTITLGGDITLNGDWEINGNVKASYSGLSFDVGVKNITGGSVTIGENGLLSIYMPEKGSSVNVGGFTVTISSENEAVNGLRFNSAVTNQGSLWVLTNGTGVVDKDASGTVRFADVTNTGTIGIQGNALMMQMLSHDGWTNDGIFYYKTGQQYFGFTRVEILDEEGNGTDKYRFAEGNPGENAILIKNKGTIVISNPDMENALSYDFCNYAKGAVGTISGEINISNRDGNSIVGNVYSGQKLGLADEGDISFTALAGADRIYLTSAEMKAFKANDVTGYLSEGFNITQGGTYTYHFAGEVQGSLIVNNADAIVNIYLHGASFNSAVGLGERGGTLHVYVKSDSAGSAFNNDFSNAIGWYEPQNFQTGLDENGVFKEGSTNYNITHTDGKYYTMDGRIYGSQDRNALEDGYYQGTITVSTDAGASLNFGGAVVLTNDFTIENNSGSISFGASGYVAVAAGDFTINDGKVNFNGNVDVLALFNSGNTTNFTVNAGSDVFFGGNLNNYVAKWNGGAYTFEEGAYTVDKDGKIKNINIYVGYGDYAGYIYTDDKGQDFSADYKLIINNEMLDRTSSNVVFQDGSKVTFSPQGKINNNGAFGHVSFTVEAGAAAALGSINNIHSGRDFSGWIQSWNKSEDRPQQFTGNANGGVWWYYGEAMTCRPWAGDEPLTLNVKASSKGVGVNGAAEDILWDKGQAAPHFSATFVTDGGRFDEESGLVIGGTTVVGTVYNTPVSGGVIYPGSAVFKVAGEGNDFSKATITNRGVMDLGYDQSNPLISNTFGTIKNEDTGSLSLRGGGVSPQGNDFGIVINNTREDRGSSYGTSISKAGSSQITIVNKSGMVTFDGGENTGLQFSDRGGYSGIMTMGGNTIVNSAFGISGISSTIHVKGGTLTFNASNILRKNIIIENGATLVMEGTVSYCFEGAILNKGIFNLNADSEFSTQATIRNEGHFSINKEGMVIHNLTNAGNISVGHQTTFVNMINEKDAVFTMTGTSGSVRGADGSTFVNLTNYGILSLTVKDLLFIDGLTNYGELSFAATGYRFANMVTDDGGLIFVNKNGAVLTFSGTNPIGTYIDLQNEGTVNVGTTVRFGRVINASNSVFDVSGSGAAQFWGHLTHNGKFTGDRTISIFGKADGSGSIDMKGDSLIIYGSQAPEINVNGYYTINGVVVGDAYDTARPEYDIVEKCWGFRNQDGSLDRLTVSDGISEYSDVRVENGTWWIGNFDTEVACGNAVDAPTLEADGYWYFRGEKTAVIGQSLVVGEFAITQNIYSGNVSNIKLVGGVNGEVVRTTLENAETVVTTSFDNEGAALLVVGSSKLTIERYSDRNETIDGNTFVPTVTVLNGGQVTMKADATINAQLALRGTLNFNGNHLTITNSVDASSSGSLHAPGKVTYQGASTLIYSGEYGQLVLDGEEMGILGNITATYLTNNLSEGLNVTGSVVRVSGYAGGTGNYVVDNGGELYFETSAAQSDYTIHGSVVANEGAGKISFLGSANKRITVNDFVNSSSNVSAGYATFTDVTNTGTFSVNNNTVTLGTFTNNGELVFDLGSEGKFSINNDNRVSGGTITLNSGTLELGYNGTVEHSRTYNVVDVNNNAELEVTANYVQLNALTVGTDASVTTSGTGIVFGAKSAENGRFTLNGSLTVDGGTLAIRGYYTDDIDVEAEGTQTTARITIADGTLTLSRAFARNVYAAIEVYGNADEMFIDNGGRYQGTVDAWTLITEDSIRDGDEYVYLTNHSGDTKFIVRNTDADGGVTLYLDKEITGMFFRVEGGAAIIVGGDALGTAGEIYLDNGSIDIGTSSLSVNNLTALGTISGSGNLTVNSSLTVSGTNREGDDVTGSIDMTGGTVTYGDSITDILTGTYFNLALNNGEYSVADIALAGALSGAGTLTISGNSRGDGTVQNSISVVYNNAAAENKKVYGGTYGNLTITGDHTMTADVTVKGTLDLAGGNAGKVTTLTIDNGVTLTTNGNLHANGSNSVISNGIIKGEGATVVYNNTGGNNRNIYSGNYGTLVILGEGEQSIATLQLSNVLKGDGTLSIIQKADGSGSVTGYTAEDSDVTEYLNVNYVSSYEANTILRGVYGNLTMSCNRNWEFSNSVVVEGKATISGNLLGSAASSIEFKGETAGEAKFGDDKVAFGGNVTYNRPAGIQYIYGGRYETINLNSVTAYSSAGVIANHIYVGEDNREVKFSGGTSAVANFHFAGNGSLYVAGGNLQLTNVYGSDDMKITQSGESFMIRNEGELIFNSNFKIADHFTNSGHIRVTGNGNTLLVSNLDGDTDARFGANSVFTVDENATLQFAAGISLTISGIENNGIVELLGENGEDNRVSLTMGYLNGNIAGAKFKLSYATTTLDGGSLYSGGIFIDNQSEFVVVGNSKSDFLGKVDNKGEFTVGKENGSSRADVYLYDVSDDARAMFVVYDNARLNFVGNPAEHELYGVVINTKEGEVNLGNYHAANYYDYWIEVSNSISTSGEGNFLEVIDGRFGYIFKTPGAGITVSEGADSIDAEIIVADGGEFTISSADDIGEVIFTKAVVNHGTITVGGDFNVKFSGPTYTENSSNSAVDSSKKAGKVEASNVEVIYGEKAITVFGGTYNTLTLEKAENNANRVFSNVTVQERFNNAGYTIVDADSIFNGTISGSGSLSFRGLAKGDAVVEINEEDVANAIAVSYTSGNDEQQIFAGEYGNITLSGGSKMFRDGTTVYGNFYNTATAVIGSGNTVTLAGSGSFVQNGTLELNGVLDVQRETALGVFTVAQGGELIFNAEGITYTHITNNGTLTTMLNYNFEQGWTNKGTLSVGKGFEVTLGKGELSGGTIANAGTVILAATNNFGTVQNSGTLKVERDNTFGSTYSGLENSGTVSVGEGIKVTLNFADDTISNTGTISNSGTITVRGTGDFGSFINSGELVFEGIGTVSELINSGTVTISAKGTEADGYDRFEIVKLVNYQKVSAGGEIAYEYGSLSVTGEYVRLVLKEVDTLPDGVKSEDSGSKIVLGDGNQLAFEYEGGKQIIYGTVTADSTQVFFESNTLNLNENNTSIYSYVDGDGWIIVDYDWSKGGTAVLTVSVGRYLIKNGGTLAIGNKAGSGLQFKVEDGGELIFAEDYIWNVEAEVSDLLGGTVTVKDGVTLTINTDCTGDKYFVVASDVVNNGILKIGEANVCFGAGQSDYIITGNGDITGKGNIFFAQQIADTQKIEMTGGTVTFGGIPMVDEEGNVKIDEDDNIIWQTRVGEVFAGKYHNVVFDGYTVKNINFTFTGEISGNADIVIDGTNVKYAGNNASVRMTGGTITYDSSYAASGVLEGRYNNLTLGIRENEVEEWTISNNITVIDTIDAVGVECNLVFAKTVNDKLTQEDIEDIVPDYDPNKNYFVAGKIINTPNVVTYGEYSTESYLLSGNYNDLTLVGRNYYFSSSEELNVNGTLTMKGVSAFGVQLNIRQDEDATIKPVMNVNGKVIDDANSRLYVQEGGTLNLNYKAEAADKKDNQIKSEVIAFNGGIINIYDTYRNYTGRVGTGEGEGSQLNIYGTGNSFNHITNAAGWYGYDAGISDYIDGQIVDYDNRYNPTEPSGGFKNTQSGEGIANYGGTITIDLLNKETGEKGTIDFNQEFISISDVSIRNASKVSFSNKGQLAVHGGKFEVESSVDKIEFNNVDVAYVFNSSRDVKFWVAAQLSTFTQGLKVYTVEPHMKYDWTWNDGEASKTGINEIVNPRSKETDIRFYNEVVFSKDVNINPSMNATSLELMEGKYTFKGEVKNIQGTYEWVLTNPVYKYIATPNFVYFTGNSNGTYEQAVENSGFNATMKFESMNFFGQTVSNKAMGEFYIDGNNNHITTLINEYAMQIDGVNDIKEIKNSSADSDLKILNATGGSIGISQNTGTITIEDSSNGLRITQLDNSEGGSLIIEADITLSQKVNNKGNITVSADNLTFKEIVNNEANATFFITGESAGQILLEKGVDNAGIFTISKAIVVIQDTFTNKSTGTLTISSSDFSIEKLNNSGSITVNAAKTEGKDNLFGELNMFDDGSLSVVGSGYLHVKKYTDGNGNTIIVSDKATLDFTGADEYKGSAEVLVKGDGTILFDKVSFANITYADWIIISGNVTLNGNTLTYNGIDANGDGKDDTKEVSSNGRFRVLAGGYLTIENAGTNALFTVQNKGKLVIAGSQEFSNVFTVENGGEMIVSEDVEVKFAYYNPLTGDPAVVNKGTITVNGSAEISNLDNTAGTLNVAGTLTVANAVIAGTVFGQGGTIKTKDKSGLEFKGKVSGNGSFVENITYSGTGAMGGTYEQDLTVNSEVVFNAATTVNGLLRIGESGNIVVHSEFVIESGAQGLGKVTVEDGTLTIKGKADISIVANGGSTHVSGSVTAMTVNGGTTGVEGKASVGLLTVNGGATYVYGTVTNMTVAEGAVVNMNGEGKVTENITVTGTVNIKSAAADINAAEMDFSEGTLVFASGAEDHSYDIKADIGTLKVTNGTNLTVNVSSAVSVTNTELESGTVLTFKGSEGSLTAANVTVAEGATLSSQVAGSLRNDNTSYSRGMAITGEINNSGTIEVNGKGNVLGIQTDALNNTGKIQAVNNGTLLLQSKKGAADNPTVVAGSVVQDGGVIYFDDTIIDANLEYWFTINNESPSNSKGKHTLTTWLDSDINVGRNGDKLTAQDLGSVNFRVEGVEFSVNVVNGNAANYILGDNGILTFYLGQEYTGEGGDVTSTGTGTRVTVNKGAEVELNSIKVDSVTVKGSLTAETVTVGSMTNSGSLTAETVTVGSMTNSGTLTVKDVTLETYTDTSSAKLEVSGMFTVAAGGDGINSLGTVSYAGEDQTIANGSYTDLTLAGSGEKTLAENGAISVSGELSVKESASLNASAGKVTYNGGNQDIAEGTYGDLALEGTGTKTAEGDFTVSGDLTIDDNTALDASAGNFTFNGEDQKIAGGTYKELNLVNGTKDMNGGTYTVNSFTAENTMVTSSSGVWTLDAQNVDVSNTHISNASSSRPIELDGTNTVTNSTGWQFFDAYGAVGEAAPGIDNKNFQALASQLGEQLRGEELTVLYEDGDILFRSNRVRSTGSVDELRNAIEDFGNEIDIEHFGVGFHGFGLDEEFDELDIADALASEMDAALKEIVEHE